MTWALGESRGNVAYEALLREIDRIEPASVGGGLSVPKRIAALALYIQATSSVPEDVALQRAIGVLGSGISTSAAGRKKASSEARAILQFGVAARPVLRAETSTEHLVRTIAATLNEINVREVTRARAAVFRGGRGGRRPGPRPEMVLQGIRDLLELAYGGDASAQAELTAIRDLLGRAPSPANAADHPAASR